VQVRDYNALAVCRKLSQRLYRLHKLTDAVNIMLWAAEFARVCLSALWHIFPARIPHHYEFLRRRGLRARDLIHLQQVIDPALLNLLFEQQESDRGRFTTTGYACTYSRLCSPSSFVIAYHINTNSDVLDDVGEHQTDSIRLRVIMSPWTTEGHRPLP